jgi:hypothetical protein
MTNHHFVNISIKDVPPQKIVSIYFERERERATIIIMIKLLVNLFKFRDEPSLNFKDNVSIKLELSSHFSFFLFLSSRARAIQNRLDLAGLLVRYEANKNKNKEILASNPQLLLFH